MLGGRKHLFLSDKNLSPANSPPGVLYYLRAYDTFCACILLAATNIKIFEGSGNHYKYNHVMVALLFLWCLLIEDAQAILNKV